MKKKDLISIIGYGSQGRAIAMNLRDSGFNVIVGLRAKSKSIRLAKKDRIVTAILKDSVRDAAVIIVAIPDHTHVSVLDATFWTYLKKKPVLVFLHGSSIHFKQVAPPSELPVLLLAPHAPGLAVRDNFVRNQPYSAFYSINNGPVKSGVDTIAKLAKGIGIPKSHLVRTTFGDEAIGDLFGEQAVLCGGLARLLKYGFETLVEGGLPKQNAYLEVAYQIDLIVSLVKTYGLEGMFKRISPMARYGSIVNGPQVIRPQVKKDMKKILSDIKSGKFIAKADTTKLAFTRQQFAKLLNSDFDKQVKKYPA